MEMDKYTRKSLEVVEKAKEKALEYDNQELTQMHLLAGLLEIDDSLRVQHSSALQPMEN